LRAAAFPDDAQGVGYGRIAGRRTGRRLRWWL